MVRKRGDLKHDAYGRSRCDVREVPTYRLWIRVSLFPLGV
jgi:hypothetical protein